MGILSILTTWRISVQDFPFKFFTKKLLHVIRLKANVFEIQICSEYFSRNCIPDVG